MVVVQSFINNQLTKEKKITALTTTTCPSKKKKNLINKRRQKEIEMTIAKSVKQMKMINMTA
jgi:hypothetical protein